MMQFTIRSDVAVEPAAIDYTPLREASGPTKRWTPEQYRTRIYAEDTDDKDAVVNSIESELADAEWARVDYRHTNSEYDDAKYRDDAEYYHDVHELRTPPTIEWLDGYEVAVDWWAGEDTETLSAPTGYSETHAIERDGVELGRVTVKEPLERIPRSGIDVRDYPDATDGDATVVSIGDEPETEPTAKRIQQLERATGKDGQGQRGIAARIDDIEDRIDELEEK